MQNPLRTEANNEAIALSYYAHTWLDTHRWLEDSLDKNVPAFPTCKVSLGGFPRILPTVPQQRVLPHEVFTSDVFLTPKFTPWRKTCPLQDNSPLKFATKKLFCIN